MIFWFVAGAFALVSIAVMALSVMRKTEVEEHPAAYDLRVYRDQLKEVDRDLARGVINDGDATRIHTEVSRRILTADAQLQAAQQEETSRGPAQRGLVVALAVIIAGASFGLYAALGEKGAPDKPLDLRFADAQTAKDNRADQATFEASLPPRDIVTPDPEFADLMNKLRLAVKQTPDDLTGFQLLAQHEADLNDLISAHHAQSNVIRIKGDDATATDYLTHANMLISAAGGYVSPEAEASLEAALEMEPTNLLGRYFWGLMMMQNGRPDTTFHIWEQVLQQSPPTAPWVAPIRQNLTDLSWYAGVKNFQLPPSGDPHAGAGLSGPSADDMEAAEEMDTEDRNEMIQGMVSQLAERLATEGGTPQEWGRLITAYSVLGNRDRAAAIWEEAQTVFAGAPGALATVKDSARQVGLAP
ncbi:MAG: c-type cytochrome biogenesis protein CcmI [Shimia sp.]|jgi:cytochrome c-type biogenesis protein CcmH|uniref:c-type cytochrome biogenesis protein CcmI n=1 Tax=Shimia sp. TaxID=1954381 RepID=UPI004059895E